MGAEMGELITKPEQIILIMWMECPTKAESGCKLRYQCDSVKLTIEAVVVLGFLFCALDAEQW